MENNGENGRFGYMPQNAGAPAERKDAPALESVSTSPAKPDAPPPPINMENPPPAGQGLPLNIIADPPAQQPAAKVQDWVEPAYSNAYETTSNMYTPGIYVGNPYYDKRSADAGHEQRAVRQRSGAGRFVRAVCLILVCVLLSGAAAYGVTEYRINKGDFTVIDQKQVVLGSSSALDAPRDNLTTPVSVTSDGMSAQDIYDMACTQVVGISTEITYGGEGFFRSQETQATVTGSGFIISSDGYILTNFHVVEDAYRSGLPIKVFMHDGSTHEAEIMGFEESNDVAVIKIDATGLNAVVIANSDNIRVGQRVYAVGNPIGEFTFTMTDGIVSALDRRVSLERKIINYFQLSAAVNSGNSGGPVYDTNGEVIGIVSAKVMSSYVEGIGFAIPINDAIAIASELIEYGYLVGRAQMGISAVTVSRSNAEFYGWVEGVYVRSVTEGSAASKAGLMVSDIIIKIGDDDVTTMEGLQFSLRKFRAGDTTTVVVRRGGESGEDVELTITFDENLTAGQPQPRQ